MTIEIRELVIKTTVSDKTTGGAESRIDDKTVTQNLVDCCVEEVLKILKREKER